MALRVLQEFGAPLVQPSRPTARVPVLLNSLSSALLPRPLLLAHPPCPHALLCSCYQEPPSAVQGWPDGRSPQGPSLSSQCCSSSLRFSLRALICIWAPHVSFPTGLPITGWQGLLALPRALPAVPGTGLSNGGSLCRFTDGAQEGPFPDSHPLPPTCLQLHSIPGLPLATIGFSLLLGFVAYFCPYRKLPLKTRLPLSAADPNTDGCLFIS